MSGRSCGCLCALAAGAALCGTAAAQAPGDDHDDPRLTSTVGENYGVSGMGDNAVGIPTVRSDGRRYVAAGTSGELTGTYTASVSDGEQPSIDDDCAADATTTCSVAVGETTTGAIEMQRDADWFAVELEAGTSYRFDLVGASSDSGTLAGPALSPLLYDDRGGLSLFNGLVTPVDAGTYFVEAHGSRGGTGTYTLAVATYEDDHPDNSTTDGTVDVRGTALGEIEEPRDADWFAVVLEAGTSYRFDLAGASSDSGTLADPALADLLYDDRGRLSFPNVNNDGGEGRDAVGVVTPVDGGTYFIEARGSRGTGTYTLAVATYEDDHPDNETTTAAVDVGDMSRGEIEEPGDADWFAVELETGTSYRFDLAGASSDSGTLADPALFGLLDRYGGGLRFNVNTDGAERRDAVGVVTPEDAGTFFVEARGSRGTGTYTLAVATYEDDHPDNETTTGAVDLGDMTRGEIEEPGMRTGSPWNSKPAPATGSISPARRRTPARSLTPPCPSCCIPTGAG